MPADHVRPIVNDEFGDTAVLLLGIHQTPSKDRTEIRPQDRYTLRQLEKYAEDVQDALRLLPGIAKVDMFGQRSEAIFIETDLSNWAQLELTTSQLESLADDRNIIQAGGELTPIQDTFQSRPKANSMLSMRSLKSPARCEPVAVTTAFRWPNLD